MMIAKGIRFLTILAVLAMAVAACAAVMTPEDAAGTEWEGGTLYLKNGEVYKLSGDIIEDSYIEKDPYETSSDFSATVVIETGDSKSLTIENGITLEVKAGVAVEIEGTVTGEGTLKVTKSITVKDGGVLSCRVTSAETNTAYSGGNINHATIDDFSKWTGKDAAEGYWTYKDKTLALNGYSGTYNFTQIDGSIGGIEHIEVNGNNVVTLNEPILRDIDHTDKVVNVLIGGYSLCSIATDGEGSLTFNVDISKVEGEHLSKHTAAIYGPVIIIDGVTVNINISGSNSDWTAEQKETMDITGLEDTANLEALNSIINVSVMSGYDSRYITGVFVAGDLNIFGKTLQAEATLAIQADNISIRAAVDTAKGDVLIYDNSTEKLGDLNATSIGTFYIDGTLRAKDVSASQKSLIGFKDAKIEGDLKNKGIMKVVGNVMVSGSFENYAEMRNDGSIGIYGAFINNQMTSLMPAVFTNNGTFEVFALKQRLAGVPAVPVTTADLSIDDTSASVNYAKIRSIHITDAVQDYNGDISFNATITVYKSEGYADVSDTFEGSVSPGPNGYTLALYGSTASVTIVYDSTVTEGPTKVGKAYAVYVYGTVKVGDDTLRLQDNSSSSGSEATVTADTVKQGGLYDISGADFDIIGGSFYSYGEVEVGSSSDATIIREYGAFYGDMTTNISDVTLEGLFNGVLTANGDGMATVANVVGDVHSSGSVTITGTMDGNVFAKGDVTVEGSLSGDIATFGSVDIKSMTGAVIITRSGGDHGTKTLRVDGDSSVSLDYITNYNSAKDAKETTQYTASLSIAGTPKGLVIGLGEGSDATASSDAVPGYFVFKSMEALDTDKETDIVLTEGRILVDSAVTLESRYCLRIQAGTTIEVVKSGGSLDVRKGSLKVSKDANALFETGSGIPEKYGKVLFIMSVEVEGGAYTVYSDVAYALLNCSEGAELVAGGSAEVDQDVIVKKDVNIVVGDVTLTFSGRNVEMEDGARITIKGAGKVIFKESGDNHSVVKEGEAIVYYSVNGTIVYGDNTVKFDKVRFTNDSTVQGTAESKIKTDLEYDEGIFTIAAGTGTGTITLKNDINDVTKSENSEKQMVFGTFQVALGTEFDAIAINDSAAKVLYKAYTTKPEIERYVMYPTSVEVEGILNLTASTTVHGDYSGSGKITIADGRSLVLDKAELPEPEAVKTVPGNLSIGIVDTTVEVNGYMFTGVSSWPGTGDLTLTPGTITIDGEKVNVMKIKGSLYTGKATAVRAACLDGLGVVKSAAIYGDTVYVIGESSTLDGGYVGAKTICMHDKPFADLIYDAVFEEDDYTIYAMFGYIDWDETSNVIIADDVAVDTLDISGRDVNIVIAEGAELKVMKLLIIGSPATLLSGEGSSIMGKVTIVEGLGAYIVAYADADLSSAEIVTWTDVPAPKYSDPVSSKLDVNNRVYATIYSAEADNLVLAKADSSLRPVIVGYVFTSWLNYNGDANAKVGETNAYAGMKATNVTVTVKFTEGVTVYCNGEEFNIYNAPTKVKYNSVFNAKISDTSRYEGTPLVNGKNAFIVTEDATLTVSGVTPIPGPEPGPGGGDSGLSLINILLIVLVVLIGIMVVILFLRLRSV